MIQEHLIATRTLCTHYNIEISFVNTLNQMGLIQIEIIEQEQFIHQEQIGNLEKIIRLYNELHVNLEGIDVVLNLLNKEQELKNEVISLKNRLKLYEND